MTFYITRYLMSFNSIFFKYMFILGLSIMEPIKNQLSPHQIFQMREFVDVEVVSDTSLSSRTIRLKVIHGSSGNPQYRPFSHAVAMYRDQFGLDSITVEYLDNKKLRESDWDIDAMLEWYLKSDAGFIITHIHQGVPYFHCSELYNKIQLLCNNKGFPNGDHLQCPVFTQDKYEYLR